MSDWDYIQKDPYDILRIGTVFHSAGTAIKIVGFCAPAGVSPEHLMVKIKYGPFHDMSHDTTMKYLHVVKSCIYDIPPIIPV